MKTMAFIDYQNFNISLKKYFSENDIRMFSVNYSKLAQTINKQIKLNSTLIKTYLFAYKPSDTLLQLPTYQAYYSWLNSLKDKPYFEIIEGRQEIRQISSDISIDINNRDTYTTQEKGSDINLAVNMISKGYQNAYDVAILVSGDSDYIPVVRELHHLGKTVVLAALPNQNISKYNEYKDAFVKIDLKLLNECKS